MRQVLQTGMSFANERIFLRCLCASAIIKSVKIFYAIILSVSLKIFLGDFFMLNLLATAPFDFATIFGNIGKRWYYYLVLVLFLAFVIIFSLTKKQKRNDLSATQSIVYTAIFSALGFLAKYFTIKVSDALQISFVASVGFLAGYMLGAGGGFAACFIGDLICGIVAPFGAYNPIIGIGTGLWGFVPGIIFSHFKGNDYIKAVISFALCFLFNSFAVNTFGLSVM